ncbi:MAG: YebC/PmpR family DNA-binding transcriptional regulator [Lentisphaeria bacterium]|jgi:YebC/PmpR family DNA-binding regulatory protein|nr:YebC/PmpR family DNA-binding transcriptional regulator [Lentisphaeria bacterium]MDY0177384.1 YebC/PmpR family DNA-binding transcriptional regulator [Lentisphaeria bacterium]
MAGHNKWSSIKHKKGAADAKRGKVFSRISKEIIMAAKEGGADPELNARLRSAITAAKNANMPNDNVERAIKKGSGSGGGAQMELLSYEGYAAGGVAVIVNCLSDNRNRTASDIRAFFTKHNCSMANSGAVSWKFHRKAKFVVEGENADEEKLFELLLEGGADLEDIVVEDDYAEIIAPANAFGDILKILEAANINAADSSIAMIPENMTVVDDINLARQVQKFIEVLEDYEDAQEVFTDIEISDQVAEQLAED